MKILVSEMLPKFSAGKFHSSKLKRKLRSKKILQKIVGNSSLQTSKIIKIRNIMLAPKVYKLATKSLISKASSTLKLPILVRRNWDKCPPEFTAFPKS